MDPNTLEPGAPLFTIDADNDRLNGAWFTGFCDFPDLPDGSPCPLDVLYQATDVDALAAAFMVSKDQPVAPGHTRFAYVRLMGGFQGGEWTPQFFVLSKLRAVRYHILAARSWAPRNQERYICRELLPSESPAGMLFTPGFYPTVEKKSGAKPASPPAISIYSEYASWLDQRFPPFPEAPVRYVGDDNHAYRWFEGYELPSGLSDFATPAAPRGIQTWAAEMWDQHAGEDISSLTSNLVGP